MKCLFDFGDVAMEDEQLERLFERYDIDGSFLKDEEFDRCGDDLPVLGKISLLTLLEEMLVLGQLQNHRP